MIGYYVNTREKPHAVLLKIKRYGKIWKMEAPGNGLLVMVNVGLGEEYVPSCKATEIDPILFATCE